MHFEYHRTGEATIRPCPCGYSTLPQADHTTPRQQPNGIDTRAIHYNERITLRVIYHQILQ